MRCRLSCFIRLLIVFFGIGPASLIVLGALFGIVAMIVATVTAIDRVPRVLLKVARVSGLGPVRTALLMKLPAASSASDDGTAARGRL